jgi:hypothetical protein
MNVILLRNGRRFILATHVTIFGGGGALDPGSGGGGGISRFLAHTEDIIRLNFNQQNRHM